MSADEVIWRPHIMRTIFSSVGATSSGLDIDRDHHSLVLMIENMTMKNSFAGPSSILHAQNRRNRRRFISSFHKNRVAPDFFAFSRIRRRAIDAHYLEWI